MDWLLKILEAKLNAQGIDWVKLNSVQLFSKEKRGVVELGLAGEPEPVKLEVAYLVEGESLVVVALETSKRWLTEAARIALARTDNRIPLPGGIKGKLIRMVL